MTTEQEPTNDDGGESGHPGESANARRMRERLEALEEQNKALMGRVRLSAFKEAGLDPEKDGMAKAVYRTYEGEPDPTKIVEFATTEYGWEPPKPRVVSDAAMRMGAIAEAGEQEAQQTRLQQADEAAVEGDWVKSGALKDAELLALAQKQRGYA